jgi:xylan 1,4-beta-xylosidase
MFEVWNEPNDQFWRGGEGHGGVTPAERAQGKQEAYFELYKYAALALKNASKKLVVGGPATCCASCWMADFVEHMDNNSVPYDFISTHAYSSCQMAGLSDVDRVVTAIEAARVILNDSTASDKPSHEGGKTPPWIITEFGSSCNQGFGNPDSPRFPSAIHDMIDSSSYTIAVVDALAGAGEPQALSYWAISDVFEESFFPVHNESFHGMFGTFIRQHFSTPKFYLCIQINLSKVPRFSPF